MPSLAERRVSYVLGQPRTILRYQRDSPHDNAALPIENLNPDASLDILQCRNNFSSVCHFA
jgi:hypothetical protein